MTTPDDRLKAQQLFRQGVSLLAEQTPEFSPTKAIHCFRKALDRDPSFYEARFWLLQTLVYRKPHRITEALKESGILIQMNPSNSEAHFLRGLLLESSGNYPASILEYEMSIGLDRNLQAKSYLRLGLVYRKLGKFAESIAALEKAIELVPAVAKNSAHMFLAESYNDAGRTEDAMGQWRLVAKRCPEWPDFDAPAKARKKLALYNV